MGYQKLSLSSFIKEMKEVTKGTHPRKFCFILGAGASRTSGIKSGQELVKIWDRDLRERNEEEYNKWRNELSINDSNMYNFYSQYYEKRFFRCPADGYNYIEKIMDSAKPSVGYVMLAHLLTNTPHNVVITTNFDHLSEDSVNYYSQNTPLIIGHESLAHYVSASPMRPTIIKIHRDLLFDPKSRTDELEKLPDTWRHALELIFSNYHPVFIGYAGNDKSLMDFLLENVSRFACDEWKYPYWLIYKTDKLEGKVSEFLEHSDGFVIDHSGFDEVMIQLGAEFDYSIPSEEDFLKDAKKRYRALDDAIKAFSDKSTKTTDIVKGIPKSFEVVDGDVTDDGLNRDVNKAIEKIVGKSDIQQMYIDANNYYRDRNFKKATEILGELVKYEPENARYHCRLGEALEKSGDIEKASEHIRMALNLEPDNSWYHYSYGDILLRNKDFETAKEQLNIAIELNPDNGWYHNALSKVYQEQKDFSKAQDEIEKAIELEPDNAWYYHRLGDIYFELDKLNEAIEQYEKAISLSPHNSWYYGCMSEILQKTGNSTEAQNAILKAIELEPDNAWYYFGYSEILYELNAVEQAKKALEKAVELEPDEPLYQNNLGEIYQELGDFETAQKHFEKAVELEPDDDLYRHNLNEILSKLGARNKAK